MPPVGATQLRDGMLNELATGGGDLLLGRVVLSGLGPGGGELELGA